MGNSNADQNSNTNDLMSEKNKQTRQNDTNVVEFDLTQTQNSSDKPSASQHTQQLTRSERNNRSVSPERFAYVVRHDPIYDPKGHPSHVKHQEPARKD